jgi:ribosomal protein S12 methylthiotransferase accessory factor
MSSQPFSLHPDLRFYRVSQQRGFLLGKDRWIALGGASYLDVLSELAHSRPSAENLFLDAERATAGALLAARGYLVETEDRTGAAELPPKRQSRPALRINLSSRLITTADVEGALDRAGIASNSTAGVALVISDSYLSQDLVAEAKRLGDDGIPWVLAGFRDAEVWFGPWFDGSDGPCYECLRQRLLHQHPVHAYIARRTGQLPDVGHPYPCPERASLDVGLGWIALQLRAALVHGGNSQLRTSLDVLAATSGQVKRHGVVRRPQCPVCGVRPQNSDDPAAAKPRLRSRVARLGADTSARSVLVEDTLRRFRHHVSPICGVVSYLEERNGPLTPELTTYAASVPRTPYAETAEPGDFRLQSYGKGRTPQGAEASALCEALERASAIFDERVDCISASLAELGPAAIAPDRVQLFSDRQRQTSESGGHGRQQPPRRMHPDTTLRWTPVWSLVHDHRLYVPTSFCYIDPPWPETERACLFESNGHAAGNCLEEAILHGFLELVERDAAAIWWYNRLRRPPVDLDALGDPWLFKMWERCTASGWTVAFLDLTSDLGIPVVAAVGQSQAGYQFGFGCDFEARRATERALTELAQTIAVGTPRRAPPGIGDLGYLAPDARAKAAPRSALLGGSAVDLGVALEACIAIVAQAGLDMLVLDQTRPDIGLTTVKVIVPGLRTLRPRLGPGRLYEVPVALHYRDSVLAEEDLTPMWLMVAEPAPQASGNDPSAAK